MCEVVEQMFMCSEENSAFGFSEVLFEMLSLFPSTYLNLKKRNVLQAWSSQSTHPPQFNETECF